MISSLLVFCALLAAAECRQPASPIELRLSLSKKDWVVGENLWYRLTVTNKGCRAFEIYDRFWFSQFALPKNWRNQEKTLIRILDAAGKEVPFDAQMAWGFHGERMVWTNDCGGAPCTKDRDTLVIAPGQSVAATPTMAAPIRREKRAYDQMQDLRILPGIRPGTPPKERERLEREWAADMQRRIGFGDVWYEPPAAVPPAVPSGFRVLEGHHLAPGTYRVEAIYAPLGLKPEDQNPDATIKRWQTEISTAVIFRSNLVSFTVEASTRSKTLDEDSARAWRKRGKESQRDPGALERSVLEEERRQSERKR